MKVTAVVVTYNRLNLLKKCIKSLLKQSYKLNSIVIVNNKSVDGTKQYLSNLTNNRIIVKNMTKNIGGAGGFSVGTKIAFNKTDSDYFWIMDDDTLPSNTALEKLLKATKEVKNNFGFLCSNVRLRNNHICNIPEVDTYHWCEDLPGNLIRVKIATFVSFFFSRDTVSKLGLPVAPMFIWGDDFEYSLRLFNYRPCYFVSDSIVYHNTKEFVTYLSLFNLSRGREKYMEFDFRNKFYAIRRYGNIKKELKQIVHMLVFIMEIPIHSKNDKCRRMYYCILGFIKGFFFNPRIQFPQK